jgi:hypothetical protein
MNIAYGWSITSLSYGSPNGWMNWLTWFATGSTNFIR